MSFRPHTAIVLAMLTACQPVVYDPYVGSIDDKDGDGWADYQEENLGSDAQDPFNWDFDSQRWPDFTQEAAAGTVGADFGWGYGQTFPDFLATDQYGNPVPLYTFFGYAVILDFGAGWCPPCRETAASAEDFWVEHRLDGVLIIHMMIDDDVDDPAGEIAPNFQKRWANDYAIDFPVLQQVESSTDAYGRLLASGVGTGAIPFLVVLDHEMKIVDSYEGSDQATVAEERALQLARRRDRSWAR